MIRRPARKALFPAAAVLAALIAPPAPAPAAELVYAVGDIACSPADAAFHDGQGSETRCRQSHTADLVDPAADAVLLAGDTQYSNGTLEEFLGSFDLSWGRFGAITHPAPGNHEYGTPGAAGYFDYFNGIGASGGPAGERSRGYYAFRLGRWLLVALNSNCEVVGCEFGSEQQLWLHGRLAATRRSCVLAYWHHPRFSSGVHASGEQTRALWRELVQAGAEIVISGHDHDYERFRRMRGGGLIDRGGIRSFVVGTGGQGLRPFVSRVSGSIARVADSFGVLRLRLGRRYRWTFLSEDGTALDSGSSGCSEAPEVQ